MDKSKLLRTYEIFDSYEKRFLRASLDRPFYFPTSEEDRQKILQKTKKILGYDESLVPQISNVEEVFFEDCGSFNLSELRYTTWESVYASASLYLPKSEKKLPLVFLFCGHGEGGRLGVLYRSMAERLVAEGFAVVVPDNIGQGDRSFMGHRNSVGPFYAGYTLQGLIVAESVALIRYMSRDGRFDTERLAAIGNSGGGTLTMMLAALCPEISVISSSGYPSEFKYIFEKERPHCSCNVFRGAAVTLDMWEIYSLFAPKPLLLEQGKFDYLIPVEYFERNARKVRSVYSIMGFEDNFESHVAKTNHSWDDDDKEFICEFLKRRLGVSAQNGCTGCDVNTAPLESRHVKMPERALDTDALSEQLSGKKMPAGVELWDIFVPQIDGNPISESEIISDLGRGSVMRVFADMECTLTVE